MSLSPEEQRLFEEVLKSNGKVSLPLLPSIPATKEDFGQTIRDENPTKEQTSPSNTSIMNFGIEKEYRSLEDAFSNAAEFLMFFDTSLRNGSKILYDWQIEELIRLSQRGIWKIDYKLLYYLLANNGSGKDAFIIAGFVVYVLCCWTRYKIVITSASDNQLNTQTRVYIKDLAENVNLWLRQNWGLTVDAIDIKAETFKAAKGFTGTEVYTFVSKVGGTVEGYHPFPDAPPKEGVIVIVNEGKSIPQEINTHLRKCTFSHWIEVSSAGEQEGTFFNAYSKAIFYPALPQAFRPFFRVITYKDTPHKLREAEEAIALYGIDDPFVKNTYLSKFSSVGQQVAITEESLDKCILECQTKIMLGVGKHAGLDLAAGGDECTLYVFEENVFLGYEAWRAKDTEATVDLLAGTTESQGLLAKWGLQPEQITADDGGLGEAVLNSLARRKVDPTDKSPNPKLWGVNRVKNQGVARRKDRYLNRGAELYGSFAMMVSKCFINWNGRMHPKLKQQLTTRHYVNQNAKYKLIDKKDEASSPDHGDAVVLAFAQISIHDFLDKEVKNIQNAVGRTPAPLITTAEIIKATFHNNMKWQLEGSVSIKDGRLVSNNKLDNSKGKFKFKNPVINLRSQYDN